MENNVMRIIMAKTAVKTSTANYHNNDNNNNNNDNNS